MRGRYAHATTTDSDVRKFDMPCRLLRFCPKCLATQQATSRESCGVCGEGLQPLLDQNGALSEIFLTARGTCCDTGCRNCPYPSELPQLANGCSAVPKPCGKCGDVFECQSGGCWCEKVKLSPATLEWLSRAYEDCLCPSCLAELASV